MNRALRFLFLVVLCAAGVRCSVPGAQQTPHFALRDGHANLACGQCHGATIDPSISPACHECHLPVRPPDHDPRACDLCHTPTSWRDVTVDHDRFLSLAGGHAELACTSCHAADTWDGLDAACESCHEGDRPGGHFEGGCAGCHTPTGWGNAVFDHRAFFPTPHHGVRSCESCHPEPEGTASFTCTGCHEHGKAETDRDHRGNSRYRYESTACLDCHPRGDD